MGDRGAVMAKDIRQQFGRMLDSAKVGLTNVHTAIQQQALGTSYFYPNTLDLQRSVKSGWLRRYGGVVRTWQRRWFTFKGDYLYYYSSQDETKPPLGVIFLLGCSVIEHPFSLNEQEKFRFELVPEQDTSGGLRDGSAGRQVEGHLLSAESEEERKDWIKVIKLHLYSSVGGAIFGQPLETTLRFEMARNPSRKVPEIVESCVEYLVKYGLDEEGLFRHAGRVTVIKQLCAEFDCGKRPPIDQPDMDVHTAASLLKQYLRDLPESLVPVRFYEPVMTIVSREFPVDQETSIDKLSQLLQTIPYANYNTLQYICRFLQEVSLHSDVNRMTIANLATVFAQAFICPELDDASLLMATVGNRTMATVLLISYSDRLFSVEYTPHGIQLITADLLGLNEDSDLSGLDALRAAADRGISFNEDLCGLQFGVGEDLSAYFADKKHFRMSSNEAQSLCSTEEEVVNGEKALEGVAEVGDIQVPLRAHRTRCLILEESLGNMSVKSAGALHEVAPSDLGAGESASVASDNLATTIERSTMPPVVMRKKPSLDSNRAALFIPPAEFSKIRPVPVVPPRVTANHTRKSSLESSYMSTTPAPVKPLVRSHSTLAPATPVKPKPGGPSFPDGPPHAEVRTSKLISPVAPPRPPRSGSGGQLGSLAAHANKESEKLEEESTSVHIPSDSNSSSPPDSTLDLRLSDGNHAASTDTLSEEPIGVDVVAMSESDLRAFASRICAELEASRAALIERDAMLVAVLAGCSCSTPQELKEKAAASKCSLHYELSLYRKRYGPLE